MIRRNRTARDKKTDILSKDAAAFRAFAKNISDLLEHPVVQLMDKQIHHSRITTLEHCLAVSYAGFRTARILGLDARSAARGALLHDLYLYDWHKTVPREGLHGFTHPGIALRNARQHFDLCKLEQNIILRHMWPLTLVPPAYPESFLICIMDKICALLEVFCTARKIYLEKLKQYVLPS